MTDKFHLTGLLDDPGRMELQLDRELSAEDRRRLADSLHGLALLLMPAGETLPPRTPGGGGGASPKRSVPFSVGAGGGGAGSQ